MKFQSTFLYFIVRLICHFPGGFSCPCFYMKIYVNNKLFVIFCRPRKNTLMRFVIVGTLQYVWVRKEYNRSILNATESELHDLMIQRKSQTNINT